MGLVSGQAASVVLDATSVVVRPAVAARQLAEAVPSAPSSATNEQAGASVGGSRADEDPGSSGRVGEAAPPRRFYGRVALDPVRMVRDVDVISDAIVAQLGRAGAEVTVRIEVEAHDDEGFTEDIRRTISENARTLKFEVHEFEE